MLTHVESHQVAQGANERKPSDEHDLSSWHHPPWQGPMGGGAGHGVEYLKETLPPKWRNVEEAPSVPGA